MTSSTQLKCYHCHLDIPKGIHLSVKSKDGHDLPMCCPGCKAVTETIMNLGLSQFYQYRDQPILNPLSSLPPEGEDYQRFDNPQILNKYAKKDESKTNVYSVNLYIEGVQCSACVWLIEKRLLQIDGIIKCAVSLNSHQAAISWDRSKLKLSQIFFIISQLGYKVHLSSDDKIDKFQREKEHQALKRLGVAGLGAMQVMMMAAGLYAGRFQGMVSLYKYFFQWISMLITIPVFLYVAMPFIKSAYRSIYSRWLNMDVPISIALIMMMFISVVKTINHQGDVYFDSVCMFLFFLTLGRYLEMRSQHKSMEVISKLSKLMPTTAIVIEHQHGLIKKRSTIPISDIKVGDAILVEKGHNIPCDGPLVYGHSNINESMLSGEFMPKTKKKGDQLYAGSQNIQNDIIMRAEKTGPQTRLKSMTQLLSEAELCRPKEASLIDKAASYFVLFVLIISFLVGVAWYFIDSRHAFWTMLSVLVISCPCALALATPIALTVTIQSLAKKGVLIKNKRFIEALPMVSHCVFDKTGTLTEGELALERIVPLADVDKNELLSIAATLEQQSNHPIAMALKKETTKGNIKYLASHDIKEHISSGMDGYIQNQYYRLGKIQFSQPANHHIDSSITQTKDAIVILLSDKERPLALFCFKDLIRPHALDSINWLKQQSIVPLMLTGDPSMASDFTADILGIDHFYKSQSPTDKLEFVKSLKSNRALVIGDGTNDVLAMAGSYISLSMGAGTELAKINSDAVLLNNDLSVIPSLFDICKRARTIIKQNISWAISYNLLALPIAASGLVEPIIAVIGMSLSSLLVTMNALRLRHDSKDVNRLKPLSVDKWQTKGAES